jgi:hypothetical protein
LLPKQFEAQYALTILRVVGGHHLLPKQFEAQFMKAGLDINRPEFGMILEQIDHTGTGGIHPNWNKEWSDFFARNPNPAKSRILRQLNKMRNNSQFKDIIIASAMNGVDPTGGRVSSRAAFSAAEDSRPPQRQSISLIAGAIERE